MTGLILGCTPEDDGSKQEFNEPMDTQATVALITPTAYISPTPLPSQTPTPTPAPSLRSEASKQHFWVGTAVDPSWLQERTFADFVAREFNMLTPEVAMKWEIIHPGVDTYDFSEGDKINEFAQQNGMLIRGHPLVWDKQLPDWVLEADQEGALSRDEWKAILREHILTVAGHYRGQIYAWDVVNEAVADDGKLRNTIWLRNIGPEYIPLAFRWAHEADPYALLFYNDNGGEGINPKSNAIYALVNDLKEANVPIHGVGLQTHTALDGPPSTEELQENIQRLSDLGLRIHITEMDVRLQYSHASTEEKLAKQAELYKRVFQVCLQAPMCEAFVTWGATDRQSWIPSYTGQPDAPLLFDTNYQPKPAYWAIMGVLMGK